MIQEFKHVKSFNGELNLSGDKSISHRAVMFGSMADGVSAIKNCSQAEDVKSTMSCFEKLGVKFEFQNDSIIIHGKGYKGFTKPSENLYAGNSGTTTRLMAGILAAQNFNSMITGDESLSSRPMMRIVEPLNQMGASITASESGTLPLMISKSENLHKIDYKLKVASAQVKSAVLLAGLHLDEVSEIIEPIATRNHTEVMLNLKTENIEEGKKVFISKSDYPKPFEMTIPADISTAAFFMVLGLLSQNSTIVLNNVTLNDTRTGIIQVLREMGGSITIKNERVEGGERLGDIIVKSSELKNVDIQSEVIPNIIDEIPILSIAGLFAEGNFVIRGAKELRVKESDRIKSVCNNLSLLGVTINEFDDGFVISGAVKDQNVTYESFGDHRIAMAFAVLSVLLKSGGSVNGFEAVAVSNPNFIKQLELLS